MADPTRFLLYGANGFTARLVIEVAASYGLQPVIAGRNEEKIKALAIKHHLDYCIADLTDAKALDTMLQEFSVVLHCAGPFSKTALPMQKACLRTGTHYLDITGEIAVFEQGASLHREAVDSNIMLMSGVGFDVVPTDCLALYLKQQLPTATHLQLAFSTVGGSVSHGTALTAAENLGAAGVIRKNGKLKKVPAAFNILQVPFSSSHRVPAMTVPWGDLSTAFRTTGIPNIETYMAVSTKTIRLAKLANYLGWLLGSKLFRHLVKRWINRRITGPGTDIRRSARSFVWGKVWNERGESKQARLNGPEGYTLTAITALLITRKVLDGNWQPGFQTPAGLYGADLILEVDGVHREEL